MDEMTDAEMETKGLLGITVLGMKIPQWLIDDKKAVEWITETIQRAEQRGREKNWELERTSKSIWDRKQGLLRGAEIAKMRSCPNMNIDDVWTCGDLIAEDIEKEANHE